MSNTEQRYFTWQCLNGHETEENYESLHHALRQKEEMLECKRCKMPLPLNTLIESTIGQVDASLVQDVKEMAGRALYNGPPIKDGDHEGSFPRFKDGKHVGEIITREILAAGIKNWKQIDTHMIEKHGKENRPKKSITNLLILGMAVKMEKDLEWLRIAIRVEAWPAIWFAQMNHNLDLTPRFVSMEGLDGRKKWDEEVKQIVTEDHVEPDYLMYDVKLGGKICRLRTSFDLETGLCVICPSIHRAMHYGKVMLITDHLLTTDEQFKKPLSNKACISYVVIESGGLDSVIRMARKVEERLGKKGKIFVGSNTELLTISTPDYISKMKACLSLVSKDVHPLVPALPQMLLTAYHQITGRIPETLLQATPDLVRLYLDTIDKKTGQRLMPIHPGLNALQSREVPIMNKNGRSVDIQRRPVTTLKVPQIHKAVIDIEPTSFRLALMEQAGNVGEEDKLVQFIYNHLAYTETDPNLHGTAICIDLSFRDSTEQDLLKRTEGIIECALRSATDTTGTETYSHNEFEGLKINFGTRTVQTEGGTTTTRTRGLIEKYTNGRKTMIEEIEAQIRKTLKQGRRLTVVVWDKDGYIVDTLTLLLAELGRISWHGYVYILNLHEQIGPYSRLHGSAKDDLEKIAMLNKVFLVNHHAVNERCEAMYKLLYKLMPKERPDSRSRKLLGSSLGVMIKSKPQTWENCLARALSKAMSQRADRSIPTASAALRGGEERKITITKAIKAITSRPCVLNSKKVMLHLRKHTPVNMMKQLDTVVWAMIGANRNDIMTDREIRGTIRKAKSYVNTKEFEEYHKKRLDHLLCQLNSDDKLDYSSPPIMLEPGKKHQEASDSDAEMD